MKQVHLSFNKQTNTIRIKTNSTDFYPKYLKYVLIYNKLPLTAKLVFDDKTFENGIEEFIKKETK